MNRFVVAALATIVAANASVLGRAWLNRTGPPSAELTLTADDVRIEADDADNSGIRLRLLWREPQSRRAPVEARPGVEPGLEPPWRHPQEFAWFDRAKLREVGFDTSVDPNSPDAARVYQRNRERHAYVALALADRAGSRLEVTDAAPDAAALRARHPDSTRVAVVPAVVRLMHIPARTDAQHQTAEPARLAGWVEALVDSLHVPRPHSDVLRHLARDAPFSVVVRWGRLHEAWIKDVSVKF